LTYFYFVYLILIVLILVVARHGFYRISHYLHIYQQHGYKSHEYRAWLWPKVAGELIKGPHLFVIPLFLIGLIQSQLTWTAFTLSIAVFGIFYFGSVKYLRSDRPKKPLVYTPRLSRQAVIAFSLYGLFAFLGIWLGMQSPQMGADVSIIMVMMILADIASPYLVLIAGLITRPLENYYQEGFKKKARKKLASMPNLKIVAITGSYGKTSVKFILKTLLQERYQVCFTPGSFNTPMGICKVINNDLNAGHQILILEMGARYEGNIKELCEIARPHVSVVTNVGVAHLETFGSVDMIAKTKSEIIEHMHPGGTAILNSDDERVLAMKNIREDVTVIRAGLNTGIFRVADISYDQDGCHFQLTDPEAITAQVKTPLLGEHNVANLLLGFGAGRHFGLRTATMAVAARRIEPVEHRLELRKNGNITVIDDAFNSNPVGAKSAVDVLSQFNSGRRIIVTPGMIELGERQDEENELFGRHIGKSGIDEAILVGPGTAPIQKGILAEGYPESSVKIFGTLFEAQDYLKTSLRDGDVVLYENDLPDSLEQA